MKHKLITIALCIFAFTLTHNTYSQSKTNYKEHKTIRKAKQKIKAINRQPLFFRFSRPNNPNKINSQRRKLRRSQRTGRIRVEKTK